jgi:outer membrane lipoprotein-sorting protein
LRTERASLTEVVRLSAALVSLAGLVPGQGVVTSPALSGEEIVAKLAAMDRVRMDRLKDYSSTRYYSLNNERFHTKAEMTAKMRYFRPGRKEFDIDPESGAGVLQQKVFRRMVDAELEASDAKMRLATQLTPANYDFHLEETGSDRGRRAYVFDISPRALNKFSIRGRVWVDAEDFAITRVEGKPAKNPSFWVRSTNFVHIYQKFGDFWLPVSNISQTDVLIFGHTTVEIRYSDYAINQADAKAGELPFSSGDPPNPRQR